MIILSINQLFIFIGGKDRMDRPFRQRRLFHEFTVAIHVDNQYTFNETSQFPEPGKQKNNKQKKEDEK